MINLLVAIIKKIAIQNSLEMELNKSTFFLVMQQYLKKCVCGVQYVIGNFNTLEKIKEECLKQNNWICTDIKWSKLTLLCCDDMSNNEIICLPNEDFIAESNSVIQLYKFKEPIELGVRLGDMTKKDITISEFCNTNSISITPEEKEVIKKIDKKYLLSQIEKIIESISKNGEKNFEKVIRDLKDIEKAQEAEKK